MSILGNVAVLKATHHRDLQSSFGGGKSGALIDKMVENT